MRVAVSVIVERQGKRREVDEHVELGGTHFGLGGGDSRELRVQSRELGGDATLGRAHFGLGGGEGSRGLRVQSREPSGDTKSGRTHFGLGRSKTVAGRVARPRRFWNWFLGAYAPGYSMSPLRGWHWSETALRLGWGWRVGGLPRVCRPVNRPNHPGLNIFGDRVRGDARQMPGPSPRLMACHPSETIRFRVPRGPRR
jgi:hypothetical protein